MLISGESRKGVCLLALLIFYRSIDGYCIYGSLTSQKTWLTDILTQSRTISVRLPYPVRLVLPNAVSLLCARGGEESDQLTVHKRG